MNAKIIFLSVLVLYAATCDAHPTLILGVKKHIANLLLKKAGLALETKHSLLSSALNFKQSAINTLLRLKGNNFEIAIPTVPSEPTTTEYPPAIIPPTVYDPPKSHPTVYGPPAPPPPEYGPPAPQPPEFGPPAPPPPEFGPPAPPPPEFGPPAPPPPEYGPPAPPPPEYGPPAPPPPEYGPPAPPPPEYGPPQSDDGGPNF